MEGGGGSDDSVKKEFYSVVALDRSFRDDQIMHRYFF